MEEQRQRQEQEARKATVGDKESTRPETIKEGLSSFSLYLIYSIFVSYLFSFCYYSFSSLGLLDSTYRIKQQTVSCNSFSVF